MFFIALLVILEIIKVPHAQEKIESLAFSVTRRPLIKNASPANNNKKSVVAEEKEIILPLKKNSLAQPYLNAQGGIVIDIDTASILFSKNADQKFALASLTKIMTAIISIENYQQNDIITVPESAPTVSGSKINLRTSEQITVGSLLYGLLLYSGNDAAHTLASKMGEEKFLEKMNQKAKDLGLNSIFYGDESGLDQRNSATLKEIALLSIYALKNPKFAKIVKTNETTIYSSDGQIAHPLKNTNRLLRDFPGTFGVKTGFTNEAGHCLIAAAQRGNAKILSVVVDSPGDQFIESKKILDWTFLNYTWYKL